MPTFSLDEWIKLLGEFYNRYGYLTAFLGTLGENTAFLGFLLPGNSLALLGAVYARLGMLNIGWVILLATLGTIFGYHIDYLLGGLLGPPTKFTTLRSSPLKNPLKKSFQSGKVVVSKIISVDQQTMTAGESALFLHEETTVSRITAIISDRRVPHSTMPLRE